MKVYKIRINKSAKKFIDKQPKNQRERIYTAISKLPSSGNIKKMKAFDNLYCLRVGDYRIIFSWKENEIIIEVMNANNRGDIYKNI